MALPRSFFIIDLALFMDIQRNLGPHPKISVSQRNLSSDTDLHICTLAGKVNYSRKQLLELKMKSTLQPDLYLLLKAQGILRNRRTHAGKFLKQSRRLFNIKPIWNSCKFTTWKSKTFGPYLNNLVQIKRQPQNLSTEKALNFCLLDARSINNKSLQIEDYVVDRGIDILAVTETWLKAGECCDYITCVVTPTGYTFVHFPRLNGIGGGVGMLYGTNRNVQQLNSDPNKSFEFKELLLHSDNCIAHITFTMLLFL